MGEELVGFLGAAAGEDLGAEGVAVGAGDSAVGVEPLAGAAGEAPPVDRAT